MDLKNKEQQLTRTV